VWMAVLAGLRSAGRQSGDCAGLYRPEGHGPAERRSCVYGLPVWQALGTWPGRAETMQASAGLGVLLGGVEIVCVWSPGLGGLRGTGLAGLKGSSSSDHAYLRSGSFG
jgi:hypothetical protein